MEDNNLCKKMIEIESNIKSLLAEREQSQAEREQSQTENLYLRNKLTKMTRENSQLNEKIRTTSKSIKNLIASIKTNQHG